jgi:preprotein translocase subunit SecF
LASTAAILKTISLILIIGLLLDLMYTWIQNAGILRMYLEKKG